MDNKERQIAVEIMTFLYEIQKKHDLDMRRIEQQYFDGKISTIVVFYIA